ncbi:flagellar filament capping protein FliD [Modestobacter roseus]|uniref:Flagellar hook-associated protein 2 n=1 Tax=Modestobacter roseus TaxID=1181884 RepID=A0A562IL63_9ACTN|nr:flagellar filament capping protein FliD [Modestobacter roseus]MQA34555.1 flagellar filament capping protein FliD [Modestobacter roseus]TWH71612.1 flagellar hook-associated protein 2 [Modestobacter roseus]
MAGMSLSTGLISGMDTGTLISQLMQVEANPQTLLKQKLSAVQADAASYRAMNTRFDALRSAAAALQTDAAWGATKVASSSTTVTVSAGSTAVAGSEVSFSVTQLAATHAVVSGATWASAGDPAASPQQAWPLTITRDGTTVGTVDVPAGATLTEAVAAINARSAELGVKASVIQVAQGDVRLQLTAATGGAAGVFDVIPPGGGTSAAFVLTQQGRNAELDLGGGLVASSATNTFTDLVPGVTLTVTKADPFTPVSVTVTDDPSAAAAKVQSLVDAANGLLESIASYTDPKSSTAILKGDSTLRGLTSQVLSTISAGIGGTSASSVGIQLTRDGTLTFDKAVFTTALADDPAKVRTFLTEKTIVSPGADGISGNADDVTTPVGLVAKLEALAKGASDTTTGSLTLLAKGSDTTARDLQDRIANWDIRLALRKQTLTRQFTAMETALGTLQNQSSWLASQIAGLPSWSKSAKS